MAQMIKWKNELIRIQPSSAKKLEYSTNNGISWMPRYHGNQYDFEFLDLLENGNEILANTTKGLFYSTSNGVSWMKRG